MELFYIMNGRDFNKPSKELALEQIYETYQIKLPATRVRLGIPRVADPRVDVLNDPNTFVPAKVDRDYNTLFQGQPGFVYLRLQLSDVPGAQGLLIDPLTYPFSTLDLLPQINTQLGTQLTGEDVVNETFTSLHASFELTAHPHSLVWVGHTLVTLYIENLGDYRQLENGALRLQENGEIRLLE